MPSWPAATAIAAVPQKRRRVARKDRNSCDIEHFPLQQRRKYGEIEYVEIQNTADLIGLSSEGNGGFLPQPIS
jgi:hypothetical protein